MNTIRIAVVQAGLGTPSTTSRLADVLGEQLVSAAQQRGFSAQLTRIDLRTIATKVTEATVSGVTSPEVESAVAATTRADILIAVSPTFNASYSGIFKGFFDLFEPKALSGKVTILGATGGTPRHSLVIELAMRPLFSYLRTMPTPTAIFASASDFASGSSIAHRAALIAEEALALLRLAGSEREETGPTAGAAGVGTEVNGLSDTPSGHVDAEPGVVSSPVGEFVPFSQIARGFPR